MKLAVPACSFLALALLAMPIANAENPSAKSIQAMPVKMGYFYLGKVKQSFAEAAAGTLMEERAKEMLRQDVQKGNDELQQLTKQNKPKEEIEKKRDQLQAEITLKQQTLGTLISSTSINSQNAINEAIESVAKENGLDIVVDASGIFRGADKFANQGMDITPFVIKRLNPDAVVVPPASNK